MRNTMDLNRVLKKEKNSLICNVDNMVVYISRHFEKYMMLNVSDNVSALAIFEIRQDFDLAIPYKESITNFLVGFVKLFDILLEKFKISLFISYVFKV